ncbi:MAG: hypothetical protein IJS40_05060 [Synergistaceae bacterium]|nr:hypothetical protein [Synergistaceae bacterium]
MKTKRLLVLLLSLALVIVASASAYALNGEKVLRLKQIVVPSPDEPGSLQKMTQVIADHKIDLNGVTIRNDSEALFMVDDAAATAAVLAEAGYSTKIEDVIAVEIPDIPGGLNSVLKVFSEAGVNLEHLYMFELNSSEVYYIFNVTDVEKTVSLLKDAGAEIK